MDTAYAARYRSLYERHWWWRAREKLVLDLVERMAPEGGFGSILDVGCGDGLLLAELGRFGEPEGVEADETLLSDESLAACTIHVTPFDSSFNPGRCYGLILMLDVLEHLDDDVAALRRASELLVAGGLLVVTVPGLPALWTYHDQINHHRLRYTKSTLGQAARAAGLEIPLQRYFFHWLAVLKLMVRAIEWLFPPTEGLPSIPPTAFNRCLYLSCRLEQEIFGRLPLPFGSSLVALCRRRETEARGPSVHSPLAR